MARALLVLTGSCLAVVRLSQAGHNGGAGLLMWSEVAMVQAGARAAALVGIGRGSGYGSGYWGEEDTK